MKTHFYNNTLFGIIGETVPECYMLLDNEYDKKCNNRNEAYARYLDYSANICKRHSDIIFFQNLITNQFHDESNNPFESSLLISSYLVGYFSAVKSFTDAISICLNKIYDLGLSPMNRDLTRNKIWGKLEKVGSENYSEYESFFEELKEWRNKSTHQLTPIVGVHGSSETRKGKSPEQISRSNVEIKLANIPGLENSTISNDFTIVEWVSPLKYLEDWNSIILELSNLICLDITKKL